MECATLGATAPSTRAANHSAPPLARSAWAARLGRPAPACHSANGRAHASEVRRALWRAFRFESAFAHSHEVSGFERAAAAGGSCAPSSSMASGSAGSFFTLSCSCSAKLLGGRITATEGSTSMTSPLWAALLPAAPGAPRPLFDGLLGAERGLSRGLCRFACVTGFGTGAAAGAAGAGGSSGTTSEWSSRLNGSSGSSFLFRRAFTLGVNCVRCTPPSVRPGPDIVAAQASAACVPRGVVDPVVERASLG